MKFDLLSAMAFLIGFMATALLLTPPLLLNIIRIIVGIVGALVFGVICGTIKKKIKKNKVIE